MTNYMRRKRAREAAQREAAIEREVEKASERFAELFGLEVALADENAEAGLDLEACCSEREREQIIRGCTAAKKQYAYQCPLLSADEIAQALAKYADISNTDHP